VLEEYSDQLSSFINDNITQIEQLDSTVPIYMSRKILSGFVKHNVSFNSADVICNTSDLIVLQKHKWFEQNNIDDHNIKSFTVMIPKYYENDTIMKYNYRPMTIDEKYGGKPIVYHFDTCKDVETMELGKIYITPS
jgi:hypothetical protein